MSGTPAPVNPVPVKAPLFEVKASILTSIKKAFQSYLASHKGTITSIAGVVATAFFGALYAQSQTPGHHLNMMAAGGATLTALFGVLAGMGKSPDTPPQSAPNKPPDTMEATPAQEVAAVESAPAHSPEAS